ncbi:MAG: hypothetical protein AMXMBFR64_26490 [Myxococcales bacterium]
MSRALAGALVAALTLSGPLAMAQDIIEDDLKKQVTETPAESADGWKLGLNLGSTISFNHNSNVVGVADGINFQIGVLLGAFANLRAGQHEWLNSLDLKETFTKTPTIDQFLKSNDELVLKTTWLYHIEDLDWLGPFVRAAMNAQVFPGYDARPDDVVLRKTLTDGTVTQDTVEGQHAITLTGAFEPTKLKEVAGLFANPVDMESARLQVQLGVGSTQTFTDGGFVVTDDDKTPELELTQLEDYIQVGAELEITLGGKLQKIIAWGVNASFFQPFYSTEERGLSGVDLMTIGVAANLSVKLAEWASLDYVLTAKREPLILDEWQVANGLLFTAGFSVFDPEPAPAP